MFKQFLLCLFLLHTSLQAIANDYSHIFRHYQVRDGLSDNLVTGFIQDKNGFIWIGTRDGLNKFDGYTFKTYRDETICNQLQNNNRIHHLDCDKNGNLWIGTRVGLYKYEEKEDKFNIIPSTQNKHIRFFQFDSDNNLWRIENGDLVQHDVLNDTYKTYANESGFDFTSFCIGEDNSIWAGDSRGYLSLLNKNDGSFKSYDMFPNHSTNTSKKIFELYSSKYTFEIYMAYESDNLKVFDPSTLKYKDLDIQDENDAPILINCFLEVNANEIWVGTDTGIFIYRKNSEEWIKILPDPLDTYGIASHFVAELYQDRENGIWIGYHQNGLSYYSPFNPFDVYYPKNDNKSLKGGVVHDICVDDYGTMWVATEDAGLSSFNKETGEFTNYHSELGQQNLTHTNIRGMAVTKDKLWIGHVIHGVDLLDIKTGKLIKNYNLYKDTETHVNSSVSTMLSINNDILLIATTDGLYKYDAVTDQFILLLKRSIGMLRQDNSNRLWIGRYYCDLNELNQPELTFHKLEIPEFNDGRYEVADVYTDKNGDIWFLLTEKGLIKYSLENESITWFTTKNGMPSNIVFRILSDDNNNVWVSTAAGLVSINTLDNSITTYTEAHGLITRQFNYHAGFKDNDGSLYFGTVKGLIHFDPREIHLNNTSPNVCITSIHTSGEELSFFCKNNSSEAQHLELKHNQSTFNINFSTLSYIAPGSIQYAYRMVETSKEWNIIGQRNIIYFTDLHPGKYTLEIKASDIYGNWAQSDSSFLHITIMPPWWASTTAYSIYILLIIGIIFFIIKFFVFRQKKSMIYEMQLFESRKEKELYQAKIDFFINIAHEIRTPLTLIKVPLERLIKHSQICERGRTSLVLMEKNTSRLIELVNQLLDFRKAETEGGSLTYVNVDIVSLLTITANRFQESASARNLSIYLDLSVDNLVVSIDKEAYTKILSNLFTNAIKYAFSQVNINLHVSDDKQAFIIDFINDGQPIRKEDQGKIFEPFYRIKEHELKPGTGLGLSLSRFLIEKHNGTISVVESTEKQTIFRIITPINQSKVLESIQEKPFSLTPVIHDYPYRASVYDPS
ncbi:hybrid sensor histidine kinase/response regulator [Parabacteroides sp. OttesenSCG-928-G07]|nr:hybrid sensor histidine kinase/response regulator [Parabacteroides sp. OttesenSCG-928-G07]